MVYLILGVNYLYAVVIGSPFFLVLVSLSNLFVLLASPNWAKRLVISLTLVIHIMAWGEDLNTYFFTTALAGILIGGTVILIRKYLTNWLYFRLFPRTR